MRGRRSAGRPRKIAAGKNMEVDVADGLAAVHAAVGNDPIAVFQMQFPGKLCNDRIDLAQVEKERTIQLPDGKSVVLRDIIYADYAAHYTTLHCKYDKDIILRANLSEIEALLCGYPYFFIPSKGLIINFHEVDAQNADTFTMSNGSLIPISRRKAKEVTEAYSSFLFEQLRKGGKR